MQAGWPRAGNGSRKVRTPQGRTLGKPQAAKADGKWHRKDTATGNFDQVTTDRAMIRSDPAAWSSRGKGEKVG